MSVPKPSIPGTVKALSEMRKEQEISKLAWYLVMIKLIKCLNLEMEVFLKILIKNHHQFYSPQE